MKARNGAIVGSLIALAAQAAFAQSSVVQTAFRDEPHWELIVGPFAVHFSNEDHHSHVFLLGLERNEASGAIWGLSVFQNSFGQPSAYAYYGWCWEGLFGNPAIYAKLSGGIIYGYKDEYENKVPFNHDGFGLGIIPAIGYRLTPNDALQVGALGTAGLIFT